jgi:hypothetical protein
MQNNMCHAATAAALSVSPAEEGNKLMAQADGTARILSEQHCCSGWYSQCAVTGLKPPLSMTIKHQMHDNICNAATAAS